MFNVLNPTASQGRFNISYEFFPPKTPEMETQLWETVNRLAALSPHFVSVTYGAGGSTRERTHHLVARIARETMMKPAAHLTAIHRRASAINSDQRKMVMQLQRSLSGAYEKYTILKFPSQPILKVIQRVGQLSKIWMR
jgi:hypothetical protein